MVAMKSGLGQAPKDIGLVESIGLCRRHGIRFAKGTPVANPKELEKALKSGKFPIVMKIISKKASHKTEVGGVITGISSAEQGARAFKEMKNAANKKRIDFSGVLVQEQAEGIEVIIGAKRDPQFGPVILFGLGGIFVEVFKDFALRIAPVSGKEALRMIEETKGAALLHGARGAKPVNVKAIAGIICAASKMMLSEPSIMELDLNPVFASPKSAIAVDARVIK